MTNNRGDFFDKQNLSSAVEVPCVMKGHRQKMEQIQGSVLLNCVNLESEIFFSNLLTGYLQCLKVVNDC